MAASSSTSLICILRRLIIHMVVIDLSLIIMNAPSVTIGSRQSILNNAQTYTYTYTYTYTHTHTPPISFLIMSADPEFFNDIILNDYNDDYNNDETTRIIDDHDHLIVIPPDSTHTISASLMPKLMADPEFF